MNTAEVRVSEIILGLGITVIGYFLKLIHNDLRAVIALVGDQQTKLAVTSKMLDEHERRIQNVETQVKTF